MTIRPFAALAGLTALLLAGAAAARTYSFTGDDVAIWNPAGEVHVLAGSGTAVEVEVSAQGRDAARLAINDQALAGRPTLRVLYPERRIVYPPLGRWSNTSTTIHSDGTWGKHTAMGELLGKRVSIKGSGSGIEAWTDLVVRVPKGRKVSVYTLAGAGQIENVDGRLLFDGGSGAVTAGKCRGELTIDLGSGSVQVNGFDGVLDVDTGSGSVRVADATGPRLRMDTGSGGVTGDHLTTDDLLVDTGSGSVEITRLDAKRGKIDTGSGGVELGLVSRAPDLDIDTGSGSVRVSVPADFSARLHLETGSGGIRSDLPVTIDEKDRGMLRGAVGKGDGRLHVDTGSGGVALVADSAPARTRTK